MLIGFEDGKVAKFPLSVYETKQNRKKLVNAYSSKSPAAGICVIDGGEKIGMLTSNNRMLILDPEDLAEKATKTTQGVQVMKLTAKTAKVTRFEPLEKFTITNTTGYGYKRLPATGGAFDGQMSIADLM